jgi:hypothetical protein
MNRYRRMSAATLLPAVLALLGCGGSSRPESRVRSDPGTTTTAAARSPGTDAWSALRRPFATETLREGERCPVSVFHSHMGDFTNLLGNGPLYPSIAHHGLLRPVPVKRTVFRRVAPSDLFVDKTLWSAAPAFRGRALIRLARLDGSSGEARLHYDANGEITGALSRELRLASSSGGRSQLGWHNWATATFVPSSGCYVFRVDTSEGSQEIVFRVQVRTRA